MSSCVTWEVCLLVSLGGMSCVIWLVMVNLTRPWPFFHATSWYLSAKPKPFLVCLICLFCDVCSLLIFVCSKCAFNFQTRSFVLWFQKEDAKVLRLSVIFLSCGVLSLLIFVGGGCEFNFQTWSVVLWFQIDNAKEAGTYSLNSSAGRAIFAKPGKTIRLSTFTKISSVRTKLFMKRLKNIRFWNSLPVLQSSSSVCLRMARSEKAFSGLCLDHCSCISKVAASFLPSFVVWLSPIWRHGLQSVFWVGRLRSVVILTGVRAWPIALTGVFDRDRWDVGTITVESLCLPLLPWLSFCTYGVWRLDELQVLLTVRISGAEVRHTTRKGKGKATNGTVPKAHLPYTLASTR